MEAPPLFDTCLYAVRYPRTPTSVIHMLAHNPLMNVRVGVAKHPLASNETLGLLCGDPWPAVAKAALAALEARVNYVPLPPLEKPEVESNPIFREHYRDYPSDLAAGRLKKRF